MKTTPKGTPTFMTVLLTGLRSWRAVVEGLMTAGRSLVVGNVCSIRSGLVVRMTNEEIEHRRRSIAMLSPGQASGLSREEAMAILEELQSCRSRGRRLLVALRAVVATGDRALRSLRASDG